MNDYAELVPIEHIPLRPARKSFPETAFLAEWQRFMATERTEWEDGVTAVTAVFGLSPFPFDQRAASVAASFITWLGTNCGGCFLQRMMGDARPYPLGSPGRENAFIGAWAIENRRIRGINSTCRTIEHLSAREGLFEQQHGMVRDWSLPSVRELTITLADLEVIECILVWLADDEGNRFLKNAEAAATKYMAEQAMVRGSAV